MTRWSIVLVSVLALAGAERAAAQETERPRLEVTAIPGAGMVFPEKSAEPEFSDYGLGVAVSYNISRFVGIEGEVGGTIGVSQDLEFGGFSGTENPPNLMSYSGNVVFSAPSRSVVPYATVGAGGLTMFEREKFGVDETQTFLAGNVGGGVKWHSWSDRWGLRGDYRFVMVRSQDDAPAFFGQKARYGHRVYAGLTFTFLH